MSIIDVIEAEGIEMIDKGEYWLGMCPFHDESHPSFVVYKDPGDRCFCFGCKVREDAIGFIQKLRDLSFTEAVDYLDVPHKISNVFIPYPKLIDRIAKEESQGVKVKKVYRELLIAMGWIKE